MSLVFLLLWLLLAAVVLAVVLIRRRSGYGSEPRLPPPYPGPAPGRPPGTSRDFWWGLLLGVGPVGVLSLISTGGAATAGSLWTLWFIGGLVWLASFVVVIVLYATRRERMASGMLAGLAIGFLVLFATCFANLATGSSTYNTGGAAQPIDAGGQRRYA